MTAATARMQHVGKAQEAWGAGALHEAPAANGGAAAPAAERLQQLLREVANLQARPGSRVRLPSAPCAGLSFRDGVAQHAPDAHGAEPVCQERRRVRAGASCGCAARESRAAGTAAVAAVCCAAAPVPRAAQRLAGAPSALHRARPPRAFAVHKMGNAPDARTRQSTKPLHTLTLIMISLPRRSASARCAQRSAPRPRPPRSAWRAARRAWRRGPRTPGCRCRPAPTRSWLSWRRCRARGSTRRASR